MRPFLVTLALALPVLQGCTPAAQQTAVQTGVALVEASCVPIVSATPAAPAEGPICVFVDELADALAAYYEAHHAKPEVVATPGKPTVVPAEIHAALARRPGMMARRAQKPVCK